MENEKANPKDDDEATVSSSVEDGESSSDYDDMPLFKYVRLVGSLPRMPRREDGPTNAFSSLCTCSTMGKVILPPDILDGSSDRSTALSKRQSDLVWKYPHHVLAMGFENGQLLVVDARTGVAVVPPDELKEPRKAVMVDVAFDASGTNLAALYANGMCTIWELRYTAATPSTVVQPTPAAAPATPPGAGSARPDNVFSSFLTGFKTPSRVATGISESPPSQQNHDPTRSTIPSLKTISVQATRVPYPASFGRPICLAIDPSYKRNRDKLIMVGFRDGRLVLTKRGFLKRRSDHPIYQGSDGAIEAIEWRGHLVAWADESGIKLFDMDTSTRIAHVDRPTGARASLYPTISSLRPNLVFETSENLLCAWGDCLMTLSVKERLVRSDNIDSPVSEDHATAAVGSGSSPQQARVIKRRTVQCTMAWELDCIACGVVPLDEDHVAVLGLVPLTDEDEGEDGHQDANGNDVEMHVMSRKEGTVIYADSLPLIQFPNKSRKEPASRFALLSSFALPRMEDDIEAKEDRLLNMDDDDEMDMDFQMPLFGTTKTEPFKDPHIKWNIKQLHFEEGERRLNTDRSQNEDHASVNDDDDSKSVDSDDYAFVLRPARIPPANKNVSFGSAFPPLMVVVSPNDAVLVGVREADDAVSHALSMKKYGLALRRALTYKRQLRGYNINELIDEYLRAVLHMNDEASSENEHNEKSLSIRRVVLAAQAMPMLLGANIGSWERWIAEFSKIPGGLFVLRENLPVRDPLLPKTVYEAILHTMLSEVEDVLAKRPDETDNGGDLIFPQMMKHFVSTLVAWGPTRSLREAIEFQKYAIDKQKKKSVSVEVPERSILMDAEKSLERRLHQTSSGYLQLPASSPQQLTEASLSPATSHTATDDSTDSLFSVDEMLSIVSSHVPILADSIEESRLTGIPANNQAALEALAELYKMQSRYKMALRCFLAIGCLHISPDVTEVEEKAIHSVNSSERRDKARYSHYGFVLAMIEHQHLHQCLLDESFLASSVNDEREKIPTPVVALVQLIGLDEAGDFLVEHCVPPPVTDSSLPLSPQARSSSVVKTQDKQSGNESLPINVVADQLRPHPKLLHWYLHEIFTKKPEMYVKFPRTAVPPRSVTELHRLHLELYVQYTDKRDSAEALSGTEAYNLDRMTTPLLSFLKAALPLGGIRPDDARRLLESERTGNRHGLAQSDTVQYPSHFAIELAYIIESFGKGTEEEAKQILDLYLNGSKSLMLAVSYAQRNSAYSSQLWTILVQHCLHDSQDDGDKKDGSLFGSLLECAALSGADLAHLVTQIPQGMNVEGLRPRLVAAVADYRWKLKMHEAASSIGTNERIVLLRELAHRSRRGTRFSGEQMHAEQSTELTPSSSPRATSAAKSSGETIASNVNTANRPMERPNRYRSSFVVPIR